MPRRLVLLVLACAVAAALLVPHQGAAQAAVPPANDDFANAVVVGALPFSDSRDTSQATTETDDPRMSCGSYHRSVWYAFTPTVAGRVAATAKESRYDTKLAVYTGTRGSLTEVSCTFDSYPYPPEVAFDVVAGTTYYLLVGADVPYPAGSLTFAVSALPPANDDFDRAASIGAVPFGDDRDTSAATSAGDDPIAACLDPANSSGASVWYRFTPTAATRIEASTEGSGYETILAVYVGTRGDLSEVACDDDAIAAAQSRLRFDAAAGTDYWIVVGACCSRSAPGGDLRLRLTSLDSTPPSLTLSIGEGSRHAYVAGTTMFFDPTAATARTFTVRAVASDPESSIAAVVFPAIFGNDGGADTVAPYRATYRMDGTAASGDFVVSATNVDGAEGTASFTVTPDSSDPTVRIAAPKDGKTVAGEILVKVRAANAEAGVARVQVRVCPGARCRFRQGRVVGTAAAAPYDVA